MKDTMYLEKVEGMMGLGRVSVDKVHAKDYDCGETYHGSYC